MTNLPAEDPHRADPVMALIRAAMNVRGARWFKGAPSHVFAELLTELDRLGWTLTRKEASPMPAEDSPTFRKAVEAGFRAYFAEGSKPFAESGGTTDEAVRAAIKAALAVLMAEECPTCEGKGFAYYKTRGYDGGEGEHGGPCRDCNGSGKNPDRFVRDGVVVNWLRANGPVHGSPSLVGGDRIAEAFEREHREGRLDAEGGQADAR